MSARLLTMPEAGRYLGRSREFVVALVAAGILPALTVGRRRYVAERDLDGLVNRDEALPAPVVKPAGAYPRRLPRTA